MRRLSYFFAGTLSGILATYFFAHGQHKYNHQDEPIRIKIPFQSSSGKPIVIFELPDEPLDETRNPTKDEITPVNAKQGIRTAQTEMGDEITAWKSTIPAGAYLKLHRHPYPRFLFTFTDGELNRQHGNQTDKLALKKNTFMVFAPDPANKFHNDFNPDEKNSLEVTVIEVKPIPKR